MGRGKSTSARAETRQRTVLHVISEFGSDQAGIKGGRENNMTLTDLKINKSRGGKKVNTMIVVMWFFFFFASFSTIYSKLHK